LVDRRAAGFPPAGRLVAVEGPEVHGTAVVDAVGRDSGAALQPLRLGPTPTAAPAHSEQAWVRISLLVPPDRGAELVGRVRTVLATRSARKEEGTVRVRVDPYLIG